jgi:hypothetical protein
VSGSKKPATSISRIEVKKEAAGSPSTLVTTYKVIQAVMIRTTKI